MHLRAGRRAQLEGRDHTKMREEGRRVNREDLTLPPCFPPVGVVLVVVVVFMFGPVGAACGDRVGGLLVLIPSL